MKVLASYPEGHATAASLTADLEILSGASLSWTTRLKRLASKFPDLDISGQALVIRDAAGWHLTAAGRKRLIEMEMPDINGVRP